MQLGGRGEGGVPGPFLILTKAALILEKNGPDFVHLYVKFTIQNVILRASKGKRFKIFPLTIYLSECPKFAKRLLP